MEDNQLLNLAIPAPVLVGCPFLDDDAEPRRKYCTHGLMTPLQITAVTGDAKTSNSKVAGTKEGGY